MPDYIQLLESKLSPHQRQALNAMTDVARARNITVFLTGGAVRDIVSGASVRDLDITVQGNPLKFKKDLEKAGFTITGEHEPSHTLYLRFGHQARVEISAARTETFPKPARPEYRPAAILDDLRRRDFTANAMALSLNEGSWGLMLDPLNGMADISARQLRLAGNYGFLEDPIRMVRATRLLSRTGWEMDERTRTRYQNAKAEGVISAITAVQRGYELEEIAYEEEPLHVIKALESEGWMEHLSTSWNSHSVDAQGLERLHERLVQLLMAGLRPDPSAAQFRLLTAKLSSSHLGSLKRLFVRTDLIHEAEALDGNAKKILQQITSKDAAKPSQLWKLLHSAKQEAVLWLFFTAKGAAIQSKFENFFTKWPEARQKIPNAILQDMRILPNVEGYAELLDKLTFAFMDNELPNEEAIRKFAEPYSPPAPPPPVIVRRSRSVKRVVDAKGKGKKASRKAAAAASGEIAMVAAGEAVASDSTAPVETTAAAGKSPTGKTAAAKAGAVKTTAAKSAAKPEASKTAAKSVPASGKVAAPAAAAKKPVAAKPEKTVGAAKHPQPAVTKAAAKSVKPAAKASAKPAVKAAASAHKPAGSVKPSSNASAKIARPPAKKSAKTSATVKVVARTSGKPAHKTIAKPSPQKAAGKPATKTTVKKATKPAPKLAVKTAAKPLLKKPTSTGRPKPAAKKKSGK